jgi:hypothetical protein
MDPWDPQPPDPRAFLPCASKLYAYRVGFKGKSYKVTLPEELPRGSEASALRAMLKDTQLMLGQVPGADVRLFETPGQSAKDDIFDLQYKSRRFDMLRSVFPARDEDVTITQFKYSTRGG